MTCCSALLCALPNTLSRFSASLPTTHHHLIIFRMWIRSGASLFKPNASLRVCLRPLKPGSPLVLDCLHARRDAIRGSFPIPKLMFRLRRESRNDPRYALTC